jgi:alkylation response protein AidB-like acyl-CoA dehydrogenase
MALHKGDGDSSGDMFGDLELAANALGICDSACEKAISLGQNHTSGGELLKEQQLVRLKIGRMSMLTEALRSYVMRVAWEHDQRIHSTNAGLVMNLSTDTVQEVTELCMDIYDNVSGPMDAGVDKLVRDSFIWSHLAGDSVQRLKVAGRIIK